MARREKQHHPDIAKLHTEYSQPAKGGALVRPLPRKGKSRKGAVLGVARRRRITFRIYSVRPPDWDGVDCKSIQDCIIKAGLLDADDWDKLSGEVISEKVHSKEDERTEITIE